MSEEAAEMAGGAVVPDAAEQAEVSEEAVEVEATESSQEGEATAPEEDKPKRKGGFQKRIDKLTRSNYELEARLQAAQQQLQSMQQQTAQQEHINQQPTLEQFNYDENAYQTAMQEWVSSGYKKQLEQQQEMQQQVQQQAAMMEHERIVAAKVEQAIEKYPDFVEKINAPGLPQLGSVNPYAYQAIIESHQMAEIAMHFAKDVEAAHKLAKMSPFDAVREVARVEMMLSSPPPTPKPQPPTKVAGRIDQGANPEDMTPEEYRDWRLSQRKR